MTNPSTDGSPRSTNEIIDNLFERIRNIGGGGVSREEVQQLVYAEVGKSETVKAAAAVAVNNAVAGINIVTKSDAERGLINSPGFNDFGAVFSITDEDGRRSWIEVDSEGKPTAHTVSILAAKLGIKPGDIHFESVDGEVPALSITDEDGRRSWLEIGEKGRPSDLSKAILSEDLGLNDIASNQVATPVALAEHTISVEKVDSEYRLISSSNATGKRTILHRAPYIASPSRLSDTRVAFMERNSPDVDWESKFCPAGGGLVNAVIPIRIVCWGDSLTYSSGALWPNEVARLTGAEVVARGSSGERAEAIAYRQGGLTAQVTVVGGIIPASGDVQITVAGTNFRPNPHQNAGVHKGSLAGVKGEILPRTSDSDPMYFRRDTSGNAVSVMNPVPWVSDDATIYRDWINIIWAGRNSMQTDISASNPGNSAAAKAVAAMVANIKSHVKRFIIFPVTNGLDEGVGSSIYPSIRAHEDYLAATYPDNFLNIRRVLIDRGLEMAGITPTAQDITDRNNDTIPASLRTDYIHHTSAAYKLVIAPAVVEFLNEKGWV